MSARINAPLAAGTHCYAKIYLLPKWMYLPSSSDVGQRAARGLNRTPCPEKGFPVARNIGPDCRACPKAELARNGVAEFIGTQRRRWGTRVCRPLAPREIDFRVISGTPRRQIWRYFPGNDGTDKYRVNVPAARLDFQPTGLQHAARGRCS